MLKKLFMAVIILGSASFAKADTPLVFICHTGMHYSKAEVGFTYKSFLDEPRPIDNKPLFKAMLNFIGYTPERYKKVWNKMYFRRALFIPRKMDTDQEVIDWVATNDAGVGYVSVAPKNNSNVEVCGL